MKRGEEKGGRGVSIGTWDFKSPFSMDPGSMGQIITSKIRLAIFGSRVRY